MKKRHYSFSVLVNSFGFLVPDTLVIDDIDTFTTILYRKKRRIFYHTLGDGLVRFYHTECPKNRRRIKTWMYVRHRKRMKRKDFERGFYKLHRPIKGLPKSGFKAP